MDVEDEEGAEEATEARAGEDEGAAAGKRERGRPGMCTTQWAPV